MFCFFCWRGECFLFSTCFQTVFQTQCSSMFSKKQIKRRQTFCKTTFCKQQIKNKSKRLFSTRIEDRTQQENKNTTTQHTHTQQHQTHHHKQQTIIFFVRSHFGSNYRPLRSAVRDNLAGLATRTHNKDLSSRSVRFCLCVFLPPSVSLG